MHSAPMLSDKQLDSLIEEMCQKLSFIYLMLIQTGFEKTSLSMSDPDEPDNDELFFKIEFIKTDLYIDVVLTGSDKKTYPKDQVYKFLQAAATQMKDTLQMLGQPRTIH